MLTPDDAMQPIAPQNNFGKPLGSRTFGKVGIVKGVNQSALKVWLLTSYYELLLAGCGH